MAAGKGEPWGEPASLPDDAVVVGSDRAGADALEAARRAGAPFPTLGLTGGDLCRTLGGRGRLATAASCDVGEVLVDGRLRLFVAHVVLRGPTLWRGGAVAVLNAQYVGRWDVAPRAHPGDGRLDVVELDAALGIGDRWKAWRRLPAGTHVPHPRIRARQVEALQVDVPKGQRVVVDGLDLGPARTVSVRVRAGALPVVV